MPKTLCFGKGGLASCISQFIHPIKPMREKYPNRPKTHKLTNLVLIAEDEKKIQRNIGVSNVYTFSYADFEGVEFTPQGDMFIRQIRKERKTSFSVMKMKKTIKF